MYSRFVKDRRGGGQLKRERETGASTSLLIAAAGSDTEEPIERCQVL